MVKQPTPPPPGAVKPAPPAAPPPKRDDFSKYIPNNEKIVKMLSEGTVLGEECAHREVIQWGLMMLIAEVGSAFYALQDRLQEKGILDEQDITNMQVDMTNPQYLQGLYMHLAKVFHEKCERIAYAALHPEEVTEYVKKKEAGENPEDPMGGLGEDE